MDNKVERDMKVPSTTERMARLVATGFGSGLIGHAPGTIGSIAGLAVWYLLKYTLTISDPILLALTILSAFISIEITLSSINSFNDIKVKDPQIIVIDEWAGLYTALLWVPADNPFAILAAFVLFRICDIIKPAPVSWAEELPGGLGVLCDDILAGILSALIVHGLLLR